MSNAPLNLASLAPEQKALFNSLTRAPKIAWPTVALWAVVLGVYLSSYVLAGIGVVPLWVGMVVNSVIGYFAFSIVHDSIHRAISTNARLNDFIGQTTVWLGAPYVDLKLFRWGHILHHRIARTAHLVGQQGRVLLAGLGDVHQLDAEFGVGQGAGRRHPLGRGLRLVAHACVFRISLLGYREQPLHINARRPFLGLRHEAPNADKGKKQDATRALE